MAAETSSKLVFFNPSVVLAGLASPTGASAEILKRVKRGKITGAISEIILDEVTRRSDKIGISSQKVQKQTLSIFRFPHPAPNKSTVAKYGSIVADYGDAHVLASAAETAADFLVSLDKKHILILQDKIKQFKIVSPGKLIQILAAPKSTSAAAKITPSKTAKTKNTD